MILLFQCLNWKNAAFMWRPFDDDDDDRHHTTPSSS